MPGYCKIIAISNVRFALARCNDYLIRKTLSTNKFPIKLRSPFCKTICQIKYLQAPAIFDLVQFGKDDDPTKEKFQSLDFKLESNWMTRDTVRRLSNLFPAFRCIGILPRIYWRETVWFCATYHTWQTARASNASTCAPKYVSVSILKCSRSSTAYCFSLEVLNIITLTFVARNVFAL